MSKMLSVIIPLYNEYDNIMCLYEKLLANLSTLEEKFEVIFINDGSKDQTEQLLHDISIKDKRFKIINFRRNFGQTAAMMAGINYACGQVIIPMDGDLQNDPGDILKLIAKLEEGYDVVSGWRKDRKDSFFKRIFFSKVANFIISLISDVSLHDYGCSLKAYRSEVIKDVKLYGEMHRFIPIYASLLGAKVTEMPVKHYPRIKGNSNYGLERIIKVVLDLIVVKFLAKYFTRPIYVFGGFAVVNMVISFISMIYATYLKFFKDTSFIQTPMPLLSVMLVITGIMSILMGLLAELIIRTYHESQSKSIYLIKSTFNLED